MKINLVKQKNDSSCGPVSVKMVHDYFNDEISMKKIYSLVPDWREGMNNTQLTQLINGMGLSVSAQHDHRWEDLIKLNTKDNVIVISYMLDGYIGHFAVVEKVTKTKITLADPERGYVTLDKIHFLRLWMDYDEMWFPGKSTDINLRWACVVSL